MKENKRRVLFAWFQQVEESMHAWSCPEKNCLSMRAKNKCEQVESLQPTKIKRQDGTGLYRKKTAISQVTRDDSKCPQNNLN